jgi:hypothetical protein
MSIINKRDFNLINFFVKEKKDENMLAIVNI